MPPPTRSCRSWLPLVALAILLGLVGSAVVVQEQHTNGSERSGMRSGSAMAPSASENAGPPGKSPPRALRPKLSVEETTRILKSTIIEEIDFDEISMAESLDTLNRLAVEAGVDGRDFRITYGVSGEAAEDWTEWRIRELKLRKVPLATALQYLIDSSKLRYVVGEGIVEMRPLELETPSARIIHEKLEQIVIPTIEIEEATFEEAVDFLRQRARELDTWQADPIKRGISFVIRKPRLEGGGVGSDEDLNAEAGLDASDHGEITVSYRAQNVSVREALEELCRQAKLEFSIGEHGLQFIPINPEDSDPFGGDEDDPFRTP